MNPINIGIKTLIGDVHIHLHIDGANEASQLELLAKNVQTTVENALKKAISAVDNENVKTTVENEPYDRTTLPEENLQVS